MANRKYLLQLLSLIAFTLLLGIYWSVRYAGSAMEGDATQVTNSAGGMLTTGKLLYTGSYHAGYAFTAVLTFVSLITGLSLQVVQLGSALWVVTIGLMAYITYREILVRTDLAVFAAFLLLIQPDFLFYVLRASHEKTTWLYALLMIFLLIRSYQFAGEPLRQLVFILLFYLVFYALATTNIFFASSFMVALVISFTGGMLISRLVYKQEETRDRYQQSRIIIIVFSCLILVFLVMNYLYPPARNFYLVTLNIADKTSALLLGAQSYDPYTYVEKAWRSSYVYLTLTGIQWLINLMAFIFWGVSLLRLGWSNRRHFLLWLLYTGFGLQLAASIVVDYSGVLSANLQVRQFTPFTLLSSPMAALAFVLFWKRFASTSLKRVIKPVAMVLAMAAAATVILKATNDPLLGNQWMFYTPGEKQAVIWADQDISDQAVWIDTSKHLSEVVSFWQGYGWQSNNTYEYGYYQTNAPYVLISR